MSTMNLPGFTAEASVYETSLHYRADGNHGARTRAIVPQIGGCGFWVICCTEHPDPNIAARCCRQASIHGCDM